MYRAKTLVTTSTSTDRAFCDSNSALHLCIPNNVTAGRVKIPLWGGIARSLESRCRNHCYRQVKTSEMGAPKFEISDQTTIDDDFADSFFDSEHIHNKPLAKLANISPQASALLPRLNLITRLGSLRAFKYLLSSCNDLTACSVELCDLLHFVCMVGERAFWVLMTCGLMSRVEAANLHGSVNA
jgi:hypothetical protein